MTILNRLQMIAVLSAALAMAGCSSLRITKFEDHSNRPMTTLEAIKTTHIAYIPIKTEHQFYLCENTDSTMSCKVSCGGSTDLACPAAMSGISISSNVR